MLRTGIDRVDQNVRIEIGNQRLPTWMVARRIRTELRPSVVARARVPWKGRYAMILVAVVLVRVIGTSRLRAAAG